MERDTVSYPRLLHCDSQVFSDVCMHRNTATLMCTQLGHVSTQRCQDFALTTELQNTDCGLEELAYLQATDDKVSVEMWRPLCEDYLHFSKRCSMVVLMNEKPEKALWSMESMKFLSLWERRGFSLRNSLSKLLQSLAAFCTRK